MTERAEIVATITEHMVEVVPEMAGQLDEERDLRDFAGFDSLGILEALVWLETTFSVTIPDEELVVDRFDTVAKMADYVTAHRAAAQPTVPTPATPQA